MNNSKRTTTSMRVRHMCMCACVHCLPFIGGEECGRERLRQGLLSPWYPQMELNIQTLAPNGLSKSCPWKNTFICEKTNEYRTTNVKQRHTSDATGNYASMHLPSTGPGKSNATGVADVKKLQLSWLRCHLFKTRKYAPAYKYQDQNNVEVRHTIDTTGHDTSLCLPAKGTRRY